MSKYERPQQNREQEKEREAQNRPRPSKQDSPIFDRDNMEQNEPDTDPSARPQGEADRHDAAAG